MEDICAVCAETVEWAAYGQCGHTDVCAVCIARLRFVCDDRRCCICKSLSPQVFITRASGTLTRIINDFSILPAKAKDGKVGSYWFHEGIQAYFDDFDAYKIIKDMCRLSCAVCDKSEAEGKQTSKRRRKFMDVEHLKDHLSRQHELFYCSLCLGNKKVFICEQKLYSRVQLRQHIRYGDSEVDGSKSERCGFSGHPFCEFCQMPFYGDNELYFHMSTEHFTCHICKRQHDTQFEYYKDYNDLEDHFREAHFLCEDNTCLDKKFVVFVNEAELKRHAALEHGGNMCRSKRNAALQLPTCFRSREREEEGYRVRTRVYGPGVSSIQNFSATSPDAEGTSSNFLHDASSNVGHSGTSDISSTANPVLSSGRLQGTPLDFRSVLMNGSEFPALPRSAKRRRRKSKKNSQETSTSTVDLLPAPSFAGSSSQSMGSSLHPYPAVLCPSRPLGIGHFTTSSSVNPSNLPNSMSSGNSSSISVNHSNLLNSTSSGTSSSSSVNHSNLLNSTYSGTSSISSASLLSNGIKHVGSSSSASDLVDGRCGEPTIKKNAIQAANKSLIDKIHATLEFDKDKFAAFKIISKEYRDGEIDAREYVAYVHQFGLAHLILDLARLCPDPQKQKELILVHKSSLGDINGTSLRIDSATTPTGKSCVTAKKKGKGKCEDSKSSKGDNLADGIVNQVKELTLNAKPSEEEPSSSNGVDHAHKVTSNTSAVAEMSKELPAEPQGIDIGSLNGGTSTCLAKTTTAGGKKKLKKSSKFLKTRLGASSASTVIDLNPPPAVASNLMVVRPNQDSILATVRGVWLNGGGRRLVTPSEALPSTQRFR